VAKFSRGKAITTREPVITVDAGLKAGRHRFQLSVVDADGRKSPPTTVDVVIVDSRVPVRG